MPLVRVEVRNEYGLGMPELYTETDREDPKAVLDGVAVAGLVGLLRQLGDLAEFAAEVFHGLQEQVLITSSRSHKLVERVHNVESALPQLEKAILGQRSHLHFAYTAGSKWHTRLGIEQNHFIYSDLPCCIMDSYDGCNDPPRLHNLDKFDIGGPGSCFKRYSDPTYFRRSSAGLYEEHFQSIPREKKKRRSLSRYRDMTNRAPVIMHGERTDFGSSNFKEKASPSQDLSVQVPQELGIAPEVDHLTSSESRNGSTYTECNFRSSHYTQSEDNNVKELSAVLRVNQDSYLDSASIDENFDNIYLAEDSLSKSAYITWDEKLEIINSTGLPKEPTVMPCITEKMMDTEVIEGLNSRVDHIEFDFHDEQPRRTPVIIRGQHDEIESETDHYMDALNTVESESEIDLDCHTKRELKQNSNVNNTNMDEMNRESHLDGNSMNSEFQALNSTSLSPKLISHESHIKANGSSNIENHGDAMKSDLIGSNEVAGLSSISLSTPEKLESEEAERSVANIETVASFIEPNSQPLLREPVSTYESPKPSWSTSGAQTTVSNLVMFWTNGGLLGLEPSKPPDFGLSAVAGPDPVEESKTNELQRPGQQKTINDIKSEASGKLPGISGLVVAQDHDGNASSRTTPGTKLVVPKDDSNNSSRMFEFKNRLLANGFRKQISLVGNERLASSVKSDAPVNTSIQKGHRTTGMPFREQFGNGTSFFSPSSPPLEHMRISFQPIDGFETSKLKLAFPDGNNNSNNNNESNGLMFPSFQLVPEPANLFHEFASDSDDDDDTFCRSSPYASDDCHSNPSESNSEQWDSSDSPRIKDHELDDAFGRTSSAESVSNSIVKGASFQQGYLDHKNYGHQSSDDMRSSQHGLLFDIPNFDSMQASQNLVTNDLTQPPPPMPPIEWRGIKPNPCVTMDKEDGLSEALTYALNLTPPEPTPPQPFKPAAKQDYFAETDSLTLKHKQPDWKNLHVQNGSSHARNGKVGEEKGDFLQQIRTKSRNLRHVSTAQATMPAGPTSFKVTAILEKAGTIRQAVGSDDGDDNWSDT